MLIGPRTTLKLLQRSLRRWPGGRQDLPLPLLRKEGDYGSTVKRALSVRPKTSGK